MLKVKKLCNKNQECLRQAYQDTGHRQGKKGRKREEREGGKQGEKVLQYNKGQLIKTERITELENHHLTATLAATNLAKMSNKYLNSFHYWCCRL